jgi:nitrite reductase (NAD(P)H)
MAPVATGDAAMRGTEPAEASGSNSNGKYSKKCVIVGFGMVGVAFVEKLLKYDMDGGRDEWEVTV